MEKNAAAADTSTGSIEPVENATITAASAEIAA